MLIAMSPLAFTPSGLERVGNQDYAANAAPRNLRALQSGESGERPHDALHFAVLHCNDFVTSKVNGDGLLPTRPLLLREPEGRPNGTKRNWFPLVAVYSTNASIPGNGSSWITGRLLNC